MKAGDGDAKRIRTLVFDSLWAQVKEIRDQETGPLPAAIVGRVLKQLPLVERRRYRRALIERLEIYDAKPSA